VKFNDNGLLDTVSVWAGSGVVGFSDGEGVHSSFSEPTGVALDWYGNIYVADKNNNMIRKISTLGVVYLASLYYYEYWIIRTINTFVPGEVMRLAGFGAAAYFDGQGSNAKFNLPSGLCVDVNLNVFVSEFASFRIRRITSSGMLLLIAMA
jgi:hypothetical protein